METPEMIDGNLRIHQEKRDFSEDPGWITNNPSHYYWDSTNETYYIEWVGSSGEYAYAPITMKAGVSQVRVEYDIKATQVDQSSDLPVGLFETDMDYRKSGSIQFFLSSNSTTNFTAVESYNTTGVFNGSTKDLGFQLNIWYHVVMVVNHDAGMVSVSVSNTGSTTELYNLTGGAWGCCGDGAGWGGQANGDKGHEDGVHIPPRFAPDGA